MTGTSHLRAERDRIRRQIDADEAGELNLRFDELALLLSRLYELDALIVAGDGEGAK